METITKYNAGDEVLCVLVGPLKGNEVAPDLKAGQEYEVKTVTIDGKGNQHLDVGLKSNLSFVSSYETGEYLPHGDKIHWCHPSRFILVSRNRSKK